MTNPPKQYSVSEVRGRCGVVARSRQSGIAHGSEFRQYAVTRHSPRRQSLAAGRVQLPCLSGLVSLATPLRSPRGQATAATTPFLSAVVAALRLMSVGLDGWRRAAGGAREDGADRRPPRWFRLQRRITQRGRACHAVLTYARRPRRLRVGRLGRQPAARSRYAKKYGRAKLTDYVLLSAGSSAAGKLW